MRVLWRWLMGGRPYCSVLHLQQLCSPSLSVRYQVRFLTRFFRPRLLRYLVWRVLSHKRNLIRLEGAQERVDEVLGKSQEDKKHLSLARHLLAGAESSLTQRASTSDADRKVHDSES